jgi:FkbM family methyltransferase
MSDYFKEDTSWKGFNIALGSDNTIQNFNIARLSNLSSFLNPKAKIEVNHVTKVKVRRLDSIFDELIKPINNPRIFLKIDTQGYDMEVIKGAQNCIHQILMLQSEISVQAIYENSPHYTESLIFYESLGFQLMDVFQFFVMKSMEML